VRIPFVIARQLVDVITYFVELNQVRQRSVCAMVRRYCLLRHTLDVK
jgi:hypothetical protein